MRTSSMSVLALVAGLASACGSETVIGPPTDPASLLPETPPPSAGEVGTDGPATVIDSGDGPELCLGGVAESLPPRCSGVPLDEWDWSTVDGWQRRGGVRWGEYVVTGDFDGERLRVSEAVPARLVDPGPPADDGLDTRCPEPAGGWQAADPELTTPEDLDAALQAASALEGFAAVWLDEPEGADPADSAESILNVAVTQDTAAAERALRDLWGGRLCVSEAERSESQLAELGRRLRVAGIPGLLEVAGGVDTLEVTVVHDDGSIQEWTDRFHGDGTVEVESALIPVEG